MNKIICLLVVGTFLFNACDLDNDSLPKNADDRTKFVGSWLCTDESVVFGTSTFTIQVNSIGSNDSLEIINWYNLGASTSAIALVADNSIIIPTQSITGISILGSGFYNNSDDEFIINFTADDGQYVDQVVSTCRK